jgi:GntP family gluconate:H+ symporter
MHPLLVLLVGIVTVVGLIVALRLNAFLALITAAVVVSLLSPGETATRISRVAEAFGATVASIGIVIALAAIVGKAMMDSGAADRIVRAFLAALGAERGATALTGSGFVLSIPVFFDTVFYLLVPLARSMYGRTGRHYLKYLMAVAAGAAVTHTLVPPTPGPLVIAGTLGVDVGMMVMVGVLVGLPAAAVGLLFAGWLDRRMPIPLRTDAGGIPDAEPAPARLPGLWASLLPILLPVLLISANTVISTLAKGADPASPWVRAAPHAALLGNSNLALLLSAAAALALYSAQRRPTRAQVGAMVEEALQSAGVIILITAAGGAFGAMLKAAQIGPAIQEMFSTGAGGSGLALLFLSFGVASLLKIAQGSSTVAMITTSGMISAMLAGAGALSFHPVYLATAIASGSLVGSWMNDSGFWIYTKMGGLTEVEALKSWTPLLALLGVTGMAATLLLALFLPLV